MQAFRTKNPRCKLSLPAMNIAYLLLGTNEGNRMDWLQFGLQQIEQDCGKAVKLSSIYETAAWGKEDQPDFLNMVVCIHTVLSPHELLHKIQDIELKSGRQRVEKWGQRTLDVDILFFNDDVIEDRELSIPHPHLHERRFTLMPLQEIAPGYIHPGTGKSVSTLLEECVDNLPVSIYGRLPID